MIRIDDSLLEELGLMVLPDEERKAMLAQIYETLEMRVGMRLAERMNDQQLDEFERFIDGDIAFTETYLTNIKPGWEQGEAFLAAVSSAQQVSQKRNLPYNENAVKSEFGALSWLETNFPDYKQVVASELEKLKAEIKQDSGKIVEMTQAPEAATPAQPTFQQPAQQPQAYSPQDQQPPMAA